MNDHSNFVVFATKDSPWARREHLLRLGTGSIDDNPLDGRRLVGHVNALTLEAAHFPGHGQGTGGSGCINGHRPNAVLGQDGVRLTGEQHVDGAVKVRDSGGLSKHQTAGNFHRCERRNSGPVAEERTAGQVEVDAFFGDAQAS